MDFRFRDKCAYREVWLKFGANMAVHRSACILGALTSMNKLKLYDLLKRLGTDFWNNIEWLKFKILNRKLKCFIAK